MEGKTREQLWGSFWTGIVAGYACLIFGFYAMASNFLSSDGSGILAIAAIAAAAALVALGSAWRAAGVLTANSGAAGDEDSSSAIGTTLFTGLLVFLPSFAIGLVALGERAHWLTLLTFAIPIFLVLHRLSSKPDADAPARAESPRERVVWLRFHSDRVSADSSSPSKSSLTKAAGLALIGVAVIFAAGLVAQQFHAPVTADSLTKSVVRNVEGAREAHGAGSCMDSGNGEWRCAVYWRGGFESHDYRVFVKKGSSCWSAELTASQGYSSSAPTMTACVRRFENGWSGLFAGLS